MQNIDSEICTKSDYYRRLDLCPHVPKEINIKQIFYAESKNETNSQVYQEILHMVSHEL